MNKFKIHDSMDAGGTIPRKESVESSLERRLRATQGAVAEGLTPKREGVSNVRPDPEAQIFSFTVPNEFFADESLNVRNINIEWRQAA